MFSTDDPLIHIKNRLYSSIILFCICFAIIIMRLFYLQVYTNSFFSYLGQRNFLRREKIRSARGNILDCEGRLLATNKPLIALYWQGSGQKVLTPLQQEQMLFLQQLLVKDVSEDIKRAERSSKLVLLKKDIGLQEISLLFEKFPYHPQLQLHSDVSRHYPYDHLASHLLGYISMVDSEIVGRMGLEKILQNTLQGHTGERLNIINSTGKKLEEHLIYQARAGTDVATTINLDIQQLAEKIFPAEHAGAFLVIDPETGAIRAMVSRPSFDPNMFLTAISQSMWHALQDNNPFLNRCFEACYPPASLFKLVTLAYALEESIISLQSTWHCIGHTQFCGRDYHCHNLYGHGTLTIQEALAQSCNIPFYDIARKIKINRLADYAHFFGLGEPTGIILPEKKGLIPTTQWKRAVHKEPWWLGENLSAVIGQSYMLVTPAQALRMISAIVEGKLVNLHIFADEAVEYSPLRLSPVTISFLKECLRQVITKGTGQKLKKLQHIEIFAKTGTAQTSDLSKRELGSQYMEHAWFVAHVRYKNFPPQAFIIVIEHAGSSAYAKQVAYEYLSEYCKYLDAQNSEHKK